jgi:hypothetical protein
MEPLEKRLTDQRDFEPFLRYLEQATNDPLRVKVLVTHALIEETIENVIAEAVPNSDCFDVPNMRFAQKLKILRSLVPAHETFTPLWGVCERLNKLRNAAAHRDYETLRDQRFTELATFFYTDLAVGEEFDRDELLRKVAEVSFGFLVVLLNNFRRGGGGDLFRSTPLP